MSKTETQSEALRLAALLQCGADDPMWDQHCEMRKQTAGDAATALRRLDAEVRELKMTVQHESLCVEAAKERIEALDAENKALRERLDASPSGVAVSAYAVGAVRIERVAQSRGDFKWAVREFGEVLNLDGEWESEPSPSARDDEFLMRCRFDTEQQAIAAALAAQAAAKTGDAA